MREVPSHVKRFVRRLGLRVRWNVPIDHNKHNEYNWDGRVLRAEPVEVEMQLHDVAHWLVCPPERRKLPEFGLGSDSIRTSDAAQVVDSGSADEEEYLACAMQLAIVVHLGLDPERVTAAVNTLYVSDEKMMKIRKLLPISKKQMNGLESKLCAAGRRKRYGDGTTAIPWPTNDLIFYWQCDAVRAGATHVIVVHDKFDNSTFPVWVMPGEDLDEKYADCGRVMFQEAIDSRAVQHGPTSNPVHQR